MFHNGEFVGRSEIKLVTSGQTFTAGFGIDSQIQVVREFQDKKTDTLLGSRYNEQQYRIALNNYKTVPVKLRLLDRIPWTENNSLAIELKIPRIRSARMPNSSVPNGARGCSAGTWS